MSEPSSTTWSVQEAPGLPWPLQAGMTGDLPDINVWLAMAVQEHPHHTWARNYWSSAVAQTPTMPGPKLWFCRTTMLGLVRLLCQPKVVGTGALELPAAWNLYLRFRAMAQIGLLADPAGCETQLAALLSSTQPPPRLWTDTYLAALSQSSGLRLVTFDKDFARFGLANCLILDRS